MAYASDKRLKENIEPITDALIKIGKIRGVSYNWNQIAENVAGYDRKERMVGLFAQDVLEVLPEAVKPAPFDNKDGVSTSGEDYLTVQYEKIVPLLVEAIKELKQRVEELESGSSK